jgi:hypothetical protein
MKSSGVCVGNCNVLSMLKQLWKGHAPIFTVIHKHRSFTVKPSIFGKGDEETYSVTNPIWMKAERA